MNNDKTKQAIARLGTLLDFETEQYKQKVAEWILSDRGGGIISDDVDFVLSMSYDELKLWLRQLYPTFIK